MTSFNLSELFEQVADAVPEREAIVAADGSIRLLGRGAQSINTGGEKVFPEEVEAVLKATLGAGGGPA